nr:ParB/RepB/Spo0J family partition protein [Stakelama flava]
MADLLADEADAADASPSPAPTEPPPEARAARARGTTLLGRESALARVASGEVRQVTQLLLDPARVRVWDGNARVYGDVSEANSRELIDSIIAEGGQKVPVVVRRVTGDDAHDYEVIAGTRRHFAISWLRAHSYPDMKLLAQVADLDDEAAFRLADIENRARKDVSDLERARNYAAALATHYDGHLTRMAERLKLSKGWLSKMIRVAAIPDRVIAAFATPSEVQLKPAYPLAQALDDPARAKVIAAEAGAIAKEQAKRAKAGEGAIAASEVLRRLLDTPSETPPAPANFVWTTPQGKKALSVQSVSRSGVTIRLHAGSGAGRHELADALRHALDDLERQGRGLK